MGLSETQAEGKGSGLGLNELLLGAVIALILTGVVLSIALYVLPSGHLELPQLQPAVRLGRHADFPVGGSRVVRWGDRVVLVVRRDEQSYFAVQGISSSDGCILQWDEASSRVFSPCSYVVYDVHGNVVKGLTTAPLARYGVFVRDGAVYVTEG
jgi:nitrite reductase/ring-hydroxylating ferredoxin subunit